MSKSKLHITVKRVYLPAAPSDGTRLLVDRLWPRGLTKADAALDDWLKDIAPSTGLRKWYAHDPQRWHEFQDRYRRELAEQGDEIARLRNLAKKSPITLLYASREDRMNSASVLRQVLLGE